MCWIDDHSRDEEPARAEAAPGMRASDRDRQAVIDRLRTHTVDGRLTLDEFEARVDEVLAAKTHADLRATLRELPEPVAPTTPHPPREPARRGAGPAIPLPVLIVVLVVVGSILMRHFAFWLIPVGFCLLGMRGGGGRHHRVSASA